MFPFGRRALSATLVLLALVAAVGSCGRTSHDDGQPSSPSGGMSPSTTTAGAAAVAGTIAGANDAGSAAAHGGTSSDVSSAGAPGISDPSTTSRSCDETDVPGAPCKDARCYGTRCGVRFNLACKGGAWSSGDSSLAWELVCPVGNEPIYDIGELKTGACCGELLPKNDVYTEPPSCNLCPEGAPVDGAPCSLPEDCAPPVIDCFYKCCCYGNTIWAQCDGKRWHVATNCSGK